MKSNLNIKSILIIAIIGVLSLVFFGKSFAANTATVNVETANIREEANSEATIVEQASNGEEVEILEKTGEWYKVRYNNIEGYIRADLLDVPQENVTENKVEENTAKTDNKTEAKKEETKQTTTETTRELGEYVCKKDTKLRIMPLISGKVLQDVKQDAKVNVLVINNKWAYVEVDNRRGWVLFSKLEKFKPEEETSDEEEQTEEEPEETTTTMYVSSEVVNLRAEANTDSESLAKLTMGTEVIVYSENDGWSKVKVDGQEGYIASSLLSDRKPEETTSRGLEEERQQVEETVTEEEVVPEEPVAVEEEPVAVSSGSGMGQQVCDYAMQFLGCPYVYGGTSPDGFDCSGFTQYVYSNFGVELNRTAADQAYNGTYVDQADLQPGDILIFSGHAGLYLGNGEFIHAENYGTGVVESSLDESYYASHYIEARRIFE